jgi:membrane protein
MTATTTSDRTDPPEGDEHADNPGEISGSGWKAVGKRVTTGVKENGVVLNASGVAFWAFVSLIPAMIALVSVYGLVADPEDIEDRVTDVGEALPEEARELLVQQLESITAAEGGALTIGLIISIAAALWTASSAINHLIEALNKSYRRKESRGFVKRRGLSLVFTIGAIVFAGLTIAVITALPAVLAAVGIEGVVRWVISIAVWPLVGLALMVGLAVLYRYGPDREPEPNWIWVSPGAVFAVVAWVLASIGFQIYVANFANYNETYGSLGAIIIMLMWLLISALVVLVGAEINNAAERQTTTDTTDD